MIPLTNLILVRHAITREYLNYTMIGQTDPELHALGRQQAISVAKTLQTTELTSIYTSPLRRSKETAQHISRFHPTVPFHVIGELKEIHLGIMEGQSSFHAYARYKDILDVALDLQTTDFAFPGGEGRIAALERFQSAIKQITDTNPDDSVCVVTHGAVIGLWLASLHGVSIGQFRQWQPDHASITRVTTHDGKFKVSLWNQTSHIPGKLRKAIETKRGIN